ncbi:MAG: permease [Fidelibacterota bacterium]|nr:MAG: permease [Candidatus Neomarinimicrobiota bacterium]
MIAHLQEFTVFVWNAFLHIWPYLLVTIPLAVAVRMSGIASMISKAMGSRPITSIFLATLVGAFSPFCSCGVIPVIWSLLVGGVPLAPVMSFWLASPSMDPEIFFLSVSTLGWQLALWRLGATFVLSLGGGLITHLLLKTGWLGSNLLRREPLSKPVRLGTLLRASWRRWKLAFNQRLVIDPFASGTIAVENADYGNADAAVDMPDVTEEDHPPECESCDSLSFFSRLLQETGSALIMVGKFKALALILEAVIVLYVPEAWIVNSLGTDKPLSVAFAAVLGVPVYTTNLAALGMVGGLLEQGMQPAAGLAFLVAGPTTTIPAMAAVWRLVTGRIFALYLLTTLFGAVILGYISQLYL